MVVEPVLATPAVVAAVERVVAKVLDAVFVCTVDTELVGTVSVSANVTDVDDEAEVAV